MLHVRIRAAVHGDLVALVNSLGQEPYFRERLAGQREKHGVLLVAWDGFTPIGDVYLWLDPAEEPEVRERLPGVPLLTHLEVAPEHRNQRIGTRLMGAAERRLRELGHDRVALGVDPRNRRVWPLYRRLGYVEWPHPPVPTTRRIYLPGGRVEQVPDVCRILVKDLREPRAGEG
ncbi:MULTISPECIES: GNAT family N-acetyltransferase [Nonomuraea]|uniref:GNAT family N-acetyltransferase n=1 Tax=Nonomuraea ferruginea TaxID=46174 RepID=A0ABT4T8C4_9ACTN|nr:MULTISPECIES: GNAT family N-acetyltransferase [Nonomuraea]MDA0645771.1 GNAT family N-acetyltransferase [Nonomuraea ferruginea]TXK41331.1 GNAT family N-acetyltransferase [Nonomuraea sp. C10]